MSTEDQPTTTYSDERLVSRPLTYSVHDGARPSESSLKRGTIYCANCRRPDDLRWGVSSTLRVGRLWLCPRCVKQIHNFWHEGGWDVP